MSDIAIGGVKIAFGGQIAKQMSIKLTGVAVEKGKIHNPLFACIGVGRAAAVPHAAGHRVARTYTRRSAPPLPEE